MSTGKITRYLKASQLLGGVPHGAWLVLCLLVTATVQHVLCCRQLTSMDTRIFETKWEGRAGLFGVVFCWPLSLLSFS